MLNKHTWYTQSVLHKCLPDEWTCLLLDLEYLAGCSFLSLTSRDVSSRQRSRALSFLASFVSFALFSSSLHVTVGCYEGEEKWQRVTQAGIQNTGLSGVTEPAGEGTYSSSVGFNWKVKKEETFEASSLLSLPFYR